jgi:hypothetical protein
VTDSGKHCYESTNDARISTNRSIFKLVATGIGLITALIPGTINILNIFYPISFPKAISEFPEIPAIRLTMSLGEEVPNTITVRLIISSEPKIFVSEQIIH